MENKHLTHKERIKRNFEKFESGKWNKFTYAHDFECCVKHVQAIFGEILDERIQQFRWENTASGVPLPTYQIITDPETIDVIPDRIIDHGTKVELIYKSKV